MDKNNMHRHQYFYAVGLSFRKADAEVRGKFSLDAQGRAAVLAQATAERY
jgi:glutamyl-tRNA reductase